MTRLDNTNQAKPPLPLPVRQNESGLQGWLFGALLLLPADHLIQNGEPLASIRGTLFLLLDCSLTLDEAIEWIYAENEILGRTPISALLEGHKAPVRRAAQSLG